MKDYMINGKAYVEDASVDTYNNGDYILIRTGNCNVPKVYRIEIRHSISFERNRYNHIFNTSIVEIEYGLFKYKGYELIYNDTTAFCGNIFDDMEDKMMKDDFDTRFVDYIEYSCKLKEKEKTYKIGDKFRSKCTLNIYMLMECCSGKVNVIKIENQSGNDWGVGEILLCNGVKVKDKQNITKKELDDGWFFDGFELIEKEKEKTYKIGDRFIDKDDGDIRMLIEYGIDKVNFVALKNLSGSESRVGGTVLHYGFKVEDKYNITKEEIKNCWDMFFDWFELMEE